MPRVRRLRNVRRLIRLIKSAASQWRNGRAYSAWRSIEGEVYLSQVRFHGLQVGTEIWYSYHAIEERWSGSCWVSFREQASASYYASLRPPGSKILIRFNPAVPNESVMLESDQANPYPVAVAMQTQKIG